MYSVKQKSKNKKLLAIVIVVALVIAGLAGFFVFTKNKSGPTNEDSGINFAPPTEEEKQAANDIKQEIADKNTDTSQSATSTSSNSSSSDGRKSVNPFITFGQQNGSIVEVGGYVEGIIEKDGTCTLTLTLGSSSVKQSQTALDDAQNTSCGVIEIPVSKLSTGDWQATLSYLSNKATGKSEPLKVKVNK